MGLAIVGGRGGGGDFETSFLLYLEIELNFQIINITMVSFEFFSYVPYV